MITCTKRIEFDYGHRVLGHGGKCRFLHGHRGVAEVTAEAVNLDNLGMVIDFGCLKTIVGGWIDSHFDHNMLLHADDPLLAKYEFVKDPKERLPYIMSNGNPTAENIAKEIYDHTYRMFPPTIKLVKIRVYETPSCYAEYIPSC